MQIFIVTAGEHYEGLRGQWVFADVAPARAKYKEFLAKGALAHIGADYVTLAGSLRPRRQRPRHRGQGARLP